MTFSADQIAEPLFGELALNKSATYFVAYSGGVDSTVLLHVMKQISDIHGFKLIALHVNHNLQEGADRWSDHCQQVCNALKVPLRRTRLELSQGSELAARNARYEWFREQVGRGNVLLTAHHRQDRAETLLFNLMRGAGSSGLSSLRYERPFFGSKLVRPLLRQSQNDVYSYAESHSLSWVEDPSNESTEFSRNHIRKLILPTLKKFRGDAVQNIARAAANLEQENSLLREIAISDLVDVREQPKHPLDNSHAICYEDMLHLSLARQANLVRFWLGSLQLHVPSKRLLENLLETFRSSPSSTTILQEQGSQFRFYQGFMYVMPELPCARPFQTINWNNIDTPINLFQKKIRVDATPKLRDLYQSANRPAQLKLVTKPDVVNPMALQGHTLNLKKWLQEIGIPPWRRQALPILTLRQSERDTVLAPVDQQLQNDWVMLDCPVGW